jgi:hypothetical protein
MDIRSRKKGSGKKVRVRKTMATYGRKTNVGDPNPSGNSVKRK